MSSSAKTIYLFSQDEIFETKTVMAERKRNTRYMQRNRKNRDF